MVLMYITLTHQLSRRTSPTTTSDLKFILWTHPLVYVRRSMLIHQFGTGDMLTIFILR